ncbi:MAG: LptF/LptG family permease [Kiritimatiellae bacterium]|nr:LptF/LptG family permease [Kiritimatiellia bacterium]
MTILQKYIARSYISAFLLGMVVLTFVLSIGLLVKATQLVIKGLDPKLILHFLAVSIPESFSFTIPLAVLVSALLVFGRLSSDGEMSAMKACGINLWSVVFPMVLFGFLLAGLSIFVNSSIAPRGYHARHLIAASAKGTSAIKLLEPGRFIEEFPNMTFWFERKEGETLYNVLIYDKSKPDFTREIRAEKALVTVEGNDITLDMYNARIDPFSEGQPGAASVGRMIHTIHDAIAERTYRPKVGGHLNGELREAITNLTGEIEGAGAEIAKREAGRERAVADLEKARTDLANAEESLAAVSNRLVAAGTAPDALGDAEDYTNALALAVSRRSIAAAASDRAVRAGQFVDQGRSFLLDNIKKRSEMRAELSRRFALGIAPVVFMLIGIPLGIRTSRRESNIGVAISMGVMILYYAFLIIAKSLSKKPEFFPHIIIWIPSIVCLVISVLLIRRNQ